MSSIESTGSSNSFAGLFSPLASVAANYLQDKMHKKMDADADGVVAKSEFQTALEEVGVKLGMGSAGDADAMFAAVDSDGNGSLTGNEVGQMLKSMFSGGANTDAFVQSRGDAGRFAELDVDGDGNISMAEFGISSTDGVESETLTDESTMTAASGDEAMSEASVVAADTSPTGPLNEEGMQALLKSVDGNADGQISDNEITAFVNQLGSQMGAASKKYSDTALASFSTRPVSQSA